MTLTKRQLCIVTFVLGNYVDDIRESGETDAYLEAEVLAVFDIFKAEWAEYDANLTRRGFA